MIHIEKGQKVLENESLRVATATGDYEDSALIEFYDVGNSDIVAGSFQAQYVKYGSTVYKFNSPAELGAEILKIDPESTHTSASYVRMTNELFSQMNNGSLEPTSLDQALTDEQAKMEDQMMDPVAPVAPVEPKEPVQPVDPVATSIDPVASSTDPVIPPTSTSTPPTPVPTDPPIDPVATSTDPVVATSTDPVIPETSPVPSPSPLPDEIATKLSDVIETIYGDNDATASSTTP